MSRIFLSHSSTNNAEAVALRDWLAAEGWKDEIFLDLDPQRGIAAGERWERALNEAASRCEAVLFLVSEGMARLGLVPQGIPSGAPPQQAAVRRADRGSVRRRPAGGPHRDLANRSSRRRSRSCHAARGSAGDARGSACHLLGGGIAASQDGLGGGRPRSESFAWPPPSDPNRPPYRGLRPLEAEDAGIFFGRDAPIIEALDRLRGLRETTPPRLLVILGASGAGKSSFLRAGLLPRLTRDDRHFLPLPIIRPERAAISGETGLLRALEGAFRGRRDRGTRAKLRAAIEGGAQRRSRRCCRRSPTRRRQRLDDDGRPPPPTLISRSTRARNCFWPKAQDEAQAFSPCCTTC